MPFAAMAVVNKASKAISALIVAVLSVACQEGGGVPGAVQSAQKNTSTEQKGIGLNQDAMTDENGVSITKVEGQKAPLTILQDFDQSPFSKFVFFHKNKNKILIDYNFFPEGSDFDSQKKEVRIPCQFLLNKDQGPNVNVSAPMADGACKERFKLDIDGAKFTLAGLEFGFDETFDLFADEFGIALTPVGFVDAQTGLALEQPFSEATLENFVLTIDAQE